MKMSEDKTFYKDVFQNNINNTKESFNMRLHVIYSKIKCFYKNDGLPELVWFASGIFAVQFI